MSVIEQGEVLVKCNKNHNSRSTKFYKYDPDNGSLMWAANKHEFEKNDLSGIEFCKK